MILFLTLVSGLCWTWVYFESIRLGFREKTYGMPLFALALNFAWEVIHSAIPLSQSDYSVQTFVNICWALADVFLIVTWLKFGRKYWPQKLGSETFLPWGFLVFAASFLMQALFVIEFGPGLGARYSAFLQNLLMSVLFLDMYLKRPGLEGQSFGIACSKWIGTLAPTVLFGWIERNNLILGVGILCSVFDLIYMRLLWQSSRRFVKA